MTTDDVERRRRLFRAISRAAQQVVIGLAPPPPVPPAPTPEQVALEAHAADALRAILATLSALEVPEWRMDLAKRGLHALQQAIELLRAAARPRSLRRQDAARSRSHGRGRLRRRDR